MGMNSGSSALVLHEDRLLPSDSVQRAIARRLYSQVATLVSTEPDRIISTTLELLEDERRYKAMANAVSPFGDGKASDRIVADIEQMFA